MIEQFKNIHFVLFSYFPKDDLIWFTEIMPFIVSCELNSIISNMNLKSIFISWIECYSVFFSHFIQNQNICYYLWMGFFLSCSSNFSYLINYFWICMGQKLYGDLRFLYVFDHAKISKQVDCSDTFHNNHFYQFLLVFCLLFAPIQIDL